MMPASLKSFLKILHQLNDNRNQLIGWPVNSIAGKINSEADRFISTDEIFLRKALKSIL